MQNNSLGFKIAMFVVMAACSVIDASALGQEKDGAKDTKTKGKFVFVVTLNPSQIQALRKDGYLKARIPEKLVNQVVAIKVQRDACFLDKSISVESQGQRNGGAMMVDVDESVIDRLEYQPVLLKVYDSGFSTVLLRHSWNRKILEETPLSEIQPTKQDSKQLLVRIKPDRAVLGYLKGMKKISFDSDLGEVKIDSEKILGVKFNVGREKKETVVLTGGDSITAQIKAESVTIKTRWGEKRIETSALDSITSAINLIFVEDKDSPGRWKIQMRPFGQRPAQNPALPGFKQGR